MNPHNHARSMKEFKDKMNSTSEKLSSILDSNELTPKEKKIALDFFNKTMSYISSLYLFMRKISDSENEDALLRGEFNKYQRNFISAAYLFESKISSNPVRKKVRDIFISTVGKYIFHSPIIKRAYDKPRGYPGDHLIFEMIYNNDYAQKGIGYFLDQWILNHPLTKGVIYRKNKVKKMLKEMIGSSKGKLDILNIGCGGSREIREIVADKKINLDNVHFTCLDQDEEALNLSKDLIRDMNRSCNVSFIKQEIVSIFLNRKQEHINKQDVVYSLGVADYLLKTTLENFLRYCYSLLKANGKLIIPLCSSHNPRLYIPLRWFTEWSFLSHDADDIRKFIQSDLGFQKVEVIWEKRKPILFIIIEK